MNYKEIRTIDDETIHKIFRDARYQWGLQDDDKEYINATDEANLWVSLNYLRRLFAMLLMAVSKKRLEHVWSQYWKNLSNNILYNEIKKNKSFG